MLVGSKDCLVQVALGVFEVSLQQVQLAFVDPFLCFLVVFDVLPSQHLPRLLTNVLAGVGDREDQSRLERPPAGAAIADNRFHQFSRAPLLGRML